MELLRARHPKDPVLDAAITHALLQQVASGEKPPTARIFRPGPTMAFGRLDALDQGRYTSALAAARAHGYTPILRLGGGHAAGYDEGSVLIELIRPNTTIAEGIPERFASMTSLLMESLSTLGITARTGELPGEYCAGDWSVNAAGVKLAGTAQRSIRGASLVTAMLIVENGTALRTALTDIYDSLSIPWRPSTAAAARDIIPSLTTADAERILVSTLAAHERLTATTLSDSTLLLAEQLRSAHAA
ncbi:lipoate--protein ligase family protein [Conexibacter woesei]|uniref:lipoate--protein ligase family protein n=1 Tax=Conexibacter woesei TaxID=191495 RepID=UPI0003F87004|nr:lipoate--protein ligase family protein [Conexibacter woesei]